MRAAISSVDLDAKSLLEKVLVSPKMENRELASVVTSNEIFEVEAADEEKFHVVCYDFGVKTNSLRNFAKAGCKITVVPAETKAEKVLDLNPDGVFLSNGPGDPASMNAVIDEIRKLAEKEIPIFGICLGHQILGQTFGAETYKLKFGHRGGNQPIKDLDTRKIEITAHNHGFAIDADSLPADLEITHVNLNDKTVAGIKHKTLPIFSVQYHPEAAPGPHDAEHHFARFIELMERNLASKTVGN
jgi:carbamoyl-phosphate synthase small subunit